MRRPYLPEKRIGPFRFYTRRNTLFSGYTVTRGVYATFKDRHVFSLKWDTWNEVGKPATVPAKS